MWVRPSFHSVCPSVRKNLNTNCFWQFLALNNLMWIPYNPTVTLKWLLTETDDILPTKNIVYDTRILYRHCRVVYVRGIGHGGLGSWPPKNVLGVRVCFDPPPLKCHILSFTFCWWITLKVAHHEGWKTSK